MYYIWCTTIELNFALHTSKNKERVPLQDTVLCDNVLNHQIIVFFSLLECAALFTRAVKLFVDKKISGRNEWNKILNCLERST